ncbi:carboxymuconolactone decarboxylase family protein [Micromonospora sp. CPCC 205371]|nr:carboxymuconolactone decarboxylase family protein [Micromonospora sp. CPCC 205371]
MRVADLMHELLRGDSPLSAAEREAIGAYVSRRNECEFCARSHGATAAHLDASEELREAALVGPDAEGIPPKLRALLAVAGAIVEGGHRVTDKLVEAAREAGATDEELHDTVLIAAAFCMVNRYVDGLGAVTPTEDAAYDQMGVRLARDGYRRVL